MSRLQKKPPAHKRGHPTLQNMNFFYFWGSFLPSWIRIRIRIQITDPDPMVRLNTDPIRIRIRNPGRKKNIKSIPIPVLNWKVPWSWNSLFPINVNKCSLRPTFGGSTPCWRNRSRIPWTRGARSPGDSPTVSTESKKTQIEGGNL